MFMLNIALNAVFLDEQSLPEDNIYLWAYHMKITNQYDQAIVLKKRYFEVVDSKAQIHVVEGIGLWDSEVSIKQNEVIEYVSGILLNHPSGVFAGFFVIEDSQGRLFQEVIPSFSLDSKYEICPLQ